MTLGEYYQRKHEHYGREDFSHYDPDLRRLFSDDPDRTRRKRAAIFLRERRAEIGRTVTRWTGQHRFVVDDVLSGMIVRCRELRLHLALSEAQTAQGAAVLVTLHTARIQRMRHLEYFR